MHLRITPLFIRKLAYMCSLFPKESEYTPEYFIYNHTALPFYKPFIPKDRYNKIMHEIKYGNLNAVYSGLGITAGSILNCNGIKYCLQCVHEDIEFIGEPYIHRTHQLQGVFACAKHKSLLMIAKGNIDSRDVLFDIQKYNNIGMDNTALSILNDEMLILTSDIDFLIQNYEKFDNLETTTNKYNCCMREKGYMSSKGLVNQVKLYKEFSAFYTENFLSQLQSNINIDYESDWLRIITRKKIITVHPIRHLLFIRFLFGSIQNFIDYSIHEDIPFAKPTDIKNLDNTMNNKIWMEEKYKREILELISNNSMLSRSEIRKINNKAYRWLYKHKKEWLESRIQRPKKHKDFYKNTRIDWNMRDKETLKKVNLAIESIKKEQTPIRITMSQIAKECNYRALPRDIHKMPLTKVFLSDKEESIEQYHKRKIDVVIKFMMKEERELVKHVILREAGISDKYYHNYDNYIEQIIGQ